MARIDRFGIGQTAQVPGILYALMGLVFGGIEVELEHTGV